MKPHKVSEVLNLAIGLDIIKKKGLASLIGVCRQTLNERLVSHNWTPKEITKLEQTNILNIEIKL